MDAMRIRCWIWCRRLLLACCGPAVQDPVPALFCVLVMGMLWVSVTIPFCRPGADAGERQGRILSMKAVQDPSACWLAIVPDAIRTRNCAGLP